MINPLKPLLTAATLFAAICTTAQTDLSQPIKNDPSVKIGKLPNGLTYYIRKNAKPEKKVELRLVVNAGSILENPDQQGLAHFMEHMGFNGSKNFPKNELVNYLQTAGVKFGADLNAYTSFDETVYILPIPVEKPEVVEKGFTVLEDWAFNNLFEKEEVEKERGVVLEESRLSKGAQARMSRQYLPKLFNGSRYADRLPIGKDSILKNFNPATLKAYYKEWYRPNLMAVVVVGDIDPAEIEKKIIAHFGKYKNPANAKPRPAIFEVKDRTFADAMVLTDEENTNSSLQVFGFLKRTAPAVKWNDQRDQMVENLVNTLINERLSELTQKEKPPFMYAFTGYSPFIRGYKTFVTFAALNQNPVHDAVNAIIQETERARQHGFLQTELERAKASLLNQVTMQYNERDKSQSGMLVFRYVNHFLSKTPFPSKTDVKTFTEKFLPGITLAEVNQKAKQMPSVKNSFALVTAPAQLKDKLPAKDTLLNWLTKAAQIPVKPYEEKALAKSLLDKEPAAGKVITSGENTTAGIKDFTLSNGTTVTIKKTDFKNDQILMDAWRFGGTHKFPLEDKSNANNAAGIIMQMGAGNFSSTDLGKFLAGKTLYVQPYLNGDEEGIQGESNIRDFEIYLQLLHLYFTSPRKDESAFRAYVAQQMASVQFLQKNPQFFFQDTLTKITYNNNPWAPGTFATEENYKDLNLDRILAIYKQIFSNAYGMHFTFVGNIDEKTHLPLIEKYIGSLPSTPAEISFKDNGARPVKGVVEANIQKGKEAKSFISIRFSGETQYTPENNMALRGLIDVLNIKIIEKLREEMSGVYGAGLSGTIQKRPYVNYSVIANIPCGPENIDKLKAAFFELIKKAQSDGGLEQKDLDKVKETWKNQFETNKKDNNYWLDYLSNGYINGDDVNRIATYEERVNKLSLKDLQDAARKFLDLNNYIIGVLYPEDVKMPETKKGF